MSSDSLLSKQKGVTKSGNAGTIAYVRRRRMRRETPESQLNSPDGKSILLQSLFEKDDGQNTNHAARMMAEQRKALFKQLKEEEEEEQDEVKMQKQAKSKPTLQTQTTARRGLKTALLKQKHVVRECKHDLISMERQKAVLEISLMTKRSEICKMDKAIAKEERQLKELEKTIEKDNQSFAEFLRENEKKSLEAQTFFEREAKSKQEKTAEIQKLTSEISTIRNEVANYEEILQKYKRYRELLFKLSPPEWREAHRAKLLNKVQVDTNIEDEQNKELEDSTFKQELKSNIAVAQARQSSAECARATSDSSEYEDDPELYFTDPKQLLELMTELTEQNLSLIKNSTRAEETLEELKQSMEDIRKRTQKEEELLTKQIDDMNKRVEEEKTRASKLKKKVQLHVLLNSEDEDDMMRALGEKVSEVYRCCVDDRLSGQSTLEKLASIEKQMSSLLHCLEDIPKERVESMQKIKDSERRSRQREEKLRLQREKQIERMKRYLERSRSNAKKTSGRKLMPRCIPAAQKVGVQGQSRIDCHPRKPPEVNADTTFQLRKQLVSRGSLKEGAYSTTEELLTGLTSSLGRDEVYDVIDALLEEIGHISKQRCTDAGPSGTIGIGGTSGSSMPNLYEKSDVQDLLFDQLEEQQTLQQHPLFRSDLMSHEVLFRLMDDLEEDQILTSGEKTEITSSNRDIRSMAFHLHHLVSLKGPEASEKMLSFLRRLEPRLFGHCLVDQYKGQMKTLMGKLGNVDMIINYLIVRGVPVSDDIKAIRNPHEKTSEVIDNLKSVEQKRIFYSILQERLPQTLETTLMEMKTERKRFEMVTAKLTTKIATVAEDEWTQFEPSVSRDDDCTWYSFLCPPGKYECSVSGLRWTCEDSPMSFKYRFGQWWEHKNVMENLQCMPAGPLLDITVTDGQFDEVYLPHWICTTANPTILEKFAVLHLDTDGDTVEKVLEVTPSHVKLPHPVFSARGVLFWFCHWFGFPVPLKCKVLIYKTRKTFLTLHVYVIPSDPALEEDLQKKAEKKGYESIENPYPEGILQMDDQFRLQSDVDGASIIPKDFKFSYESRYPNYIWVFIEQPGNKFTLTLENGAGTVWSCEIRQSDYSMCLK
ncbi:cilia- and flagella-associated protein 100 [Vanacampus margaritifer]